MSRDLRQKARITYYPDSAMDKFRQNLTYYTETTMSTPKQSGSSSVAASTAGNADTSTAPRSTPAPHGSEEPPTAEEQRRRNEPIQSFKRKFTGELKQIECNGHFAQLDVDCLPEVGGPTSHGKRKCVLFESEWMTPTEFESACGFGARKNWRSSVRMDGRSIKQHIEAITAEKNAEESAGSQYGLSKVAKRENWTRAEEKSSSPPLARKSKPASAEKPRAKSAQAVAVALPTSYQPMPFYPLSGTVVAPSVAAAATRSSPQTPRMSSGYVSAPAPIYPPALLNVSEAYQHHRHHHNSKTGNTASPISLVTAPTPIARGSKFGSSATPPEKRRARSPSHHTSSTGNHATSTGRRSRQPADNGCHGTEHAGERLVYEVATPTGQHMLVHDASDEAECSHVMGVSAQDTPPNQGDGEKFDLIFRCPLPEGHPRDWTMYNVADYLRRHAQAKVADICEQEEIDGRALLSLREDHLLNRFKLQLGPALNLVELIHQLREYFSLARQ